MMKRHKYLQALVIFTIVTTCQLTKRDSCPHGCKCTYEVGSHIKEMSCDGRDSVPPSEDVFNVKILNMSGNSLIVIPEKSFAAASQIMLLDLSFNMINVIENGAFGSAKLPRLLSLNISHNYLNTLPRNLTSSLKHLKVTSNRIQKIQMSDLCHLENLESLYLDDNEITEIILEQVNKATTEQCHNKIFLQKLEILSMANNMVETIDKSVWKYTSQIQYLSLANNVIKTLKADSFKGLRMLKYVDLSGNKIKTVAHKTFHHLQDLKYLSLAGNVIEKFPEELPMIEWFDISNNRITEISEGKKNSLYPQEVFLIGQNPLHCDCAMLWVKEFYDTREYQLKYMEVDTEKFIPVCSTPDHLHGDTWDVLANDAFGCNENPLDSSNQDEDDMLIWKLKDLSVKIVEVGDTFLKVEWDSVNIGVQSDEKQVIIFHIHPFGKKNQRKSVSVHPQIGRYVLKALNSSTAYIVCMSVMTDKPSSPVNTYTPDNCLEIVTKDTTVEEESWIFYFLKHPTFYLVTLTVSICFFYTRCT